MKKQDWTGGFSRAILPAKASSPANIHENRVFGGLEVLAGEATLPAKASSPADIQTGTTLYS